MAGELIALEGNEIVMRFSADAAAFAFANDPDPAARPPVSDKAQWLRDVFHALTAEDEVGESLITRALDKAMHEAWQQGSLGLNHDALGVEACRHSKVVPSTGTCMECWKPNADGVEGRKP